MTSNNKKYVYIAMLVSIGIVIHLIENSVPVPVGFPGAKLGFANIVSLLTIAVFGLKTGLGVAAARSILGSLLSGSISSIPYSFNGAVFSAVVMWATYKYMTPFFSFIGVSVIGAAAHNFAQIVTAVFLLNTPGLFVYFPVLIIMGTITGLFVGLTGNATVKQLRASVTANKFKI